MTWRALWPGGGETVGPDAAGLLAAIGSEQTVDYCQANIRATLAWRCHVLVNDVPDVNATPEAFLIRVAELGLFTLRVGAT